MNKTEGEADRLPHRFLLNGYIRFISEKKFSGSFSCLGLGFKYACKYFCCDLETPLVIYLTFIKSQSSILIQ
jgi:hypothetical protein